VPFLGGKPTVASQHLITSTDKSSSNVEPKLQAHETVTFDVLFAPVALERIRRWLQLYIDLSWPQDTAGTHTFALELPVEGSGSPHPAIAVPTLLCAPGVVCVGESVAQLLRLINPSRAPARFTISGAPPSVRAEPSVGIVPPEATLDVVVTTIAEDAPLEARLVVAFVHGAVHDVVVRVMHTMTPEVAVNTRPIAFGILAMGSVVERTIEMRNTSRTVTVGWRVAEIQGSPVATGGTSCSFDATDGQLAPNEVAHVTVTLLAHSAGSYRSRIVVSCGVHCYAILVSATVVEPKLLLGPGDDDLALGVVFEGVPVQRTLTLRNATQLTTRWLANVSAVGGYEDTVNVSWGCLSGELEAGGASQLLVSLTFATAGAVDCLLVLDIVGTPTPLVVRVRADCRSLSVHFSLRNTTATAAPVEAAPGPGPSAPPRLIDFGQHVPIGEMRECVLIIRNESAIAAPVRVWVETFGVPGESSGGGVNMKRSARTPQNGGGVVLSAAHEAAAPFFAAAGNEIISRRAAQVLPSGLLVIDACAFVVLSASMQLPWRCSRRSITLRRSVALLGSIVRLKPAAKPTGCTQGLPLVVVPTQACSMLSS
jgi:hypothetical protein